MMCDQTTNSMEKTQLPCSKCSMCALLSTVSSSSLPFLCLSVFSAWIWESYWNACPLPKGWYGVVWEPRIQLFVAEQTTGSQILSPCHDVFLLDQNWKQSDHKPSPPLFWLTCFLLYMPVQCVKWFNTAKMYSYPCLQVSRCKKSTDKSSNG